MCSLHFFFLRNYLWGLFRTRMRTKKRKSLKKFFFSKRILNLLECFLTCFRFVRFQLFFFSFFFFFVWCNQIWLFWFFLFSLYPWTGLSCFRLVHSIYSIESCGTSRYRFCFASKKTPNRFALDSSSFNVEFLLVCFLQCSSYRSLDGHNEFLHPYLYVCVLCI